MYQQFKASWRVEGCKINVFKLSKYSNDFPPSHGSRGVIIVCFSKAMLDNLPYVLLCLNCHKNSLAEFIHRSNQPISICQKDSLTNF